VRNISVFNPVPLYNHGMVVDIDGEVFPSNAVFCDDFKSERDNLRMGSVHKPAEIDWELPDRIDWAGIFKNGLDKDVYDSTMRVNDLLTEFVQNLARTRSGYAAVAVG
jgi:hypothetical protein